MSIYDRYTDGELIRMDHPLFMARTQSRIDAGWTATEGVPLADALRTVRARIKQLFGDVPLALVDTIVFKVYAVRATQGPGEAA